MPHAARRHRPRMDWPHLLALCCLAVTATSLAARPSRDVPERRIAVFGSSVASGTGDESGGEGYAGRLRALLAPRGWELFNQSRGGDNTAMLMSRFDPGTAPEPGVRYLLTVRPRFVVIALSLGNEGIRGADGAAAKAGVFEQYASGVQAVVERSRAQGITPIVTLCYTRNDFTSIEYAYTRQMNARINAWDVPSVNLLGAVDDGSGKWVDGFWWDSLHPNAAGHAEMATTFVPSLFDALAQGKPQPRRSTDAGFARLSDDAAFLFTPDAPMHPFALGFEVRSNHDGLVASVTGTPLDATPVDTTIERAAQAPVVVHSLLLRPAVGVGGVQTPERRAALGVRDGVWTYTSTGDRAVPSAVRADGRWHHVLVSHYTARGETLLFVDGILAGRTPERMAVSRIAVGGPASGSVDVKNVMIYRGGLNADEAGALAGGTLLQASLEVYAPLADARFSKGLPVENRAQSLSAFTLVSGSPHHVQP